MSEKDPTGAKSQQSGGLGLGKLSMNEVAPSSRLSPEETVPERKSKMGIIAFGVLLFAVFLALMIRVAGNMAPGEEAERRLRERLENLPVFQRGIIIQAHYVTGNRVRVEVARALSSARDEDREVIREAVRSVMNELRQERPNRDLVVEGYQGERSIVRGEYRHKSTLIGPGGEPVPDILIKVEGDPEGGMGEAMGRRGTPGM